MCVNFPENRAIDHATGNYLVTAPIYERPGDMQVFRMFYFQGYPYVITAESQLDFEYKFYGVKPAPDRYELVTSEIKEAFKVFGRTGRGPEDTDRRRHQKIDVVFNGKD